MLAGNSSLIEVPSDVELRSVIVVFWWVCVGLDDNRCFVQLYLSQNQFGVQGVTSIVCGTIFEMCLN